MCHLQDLSCMPLPCLHVSPVSAVAERHAQDHQEENGSINPLFGTPIRKRTSGPELTRNQIENITRDLRPWMQTQNGNACASTVVVTLSITCTYLVKPGRPFCAMDIAQIAIHEQNKNLFVVRCPAAFMHVLVINCPKVKVLLWKWTTI